MNLVTIDKPRFLKDVETGKTYVFDGKDCTLVDGLDVGPVKVMGDTLTWDGNTEGRESFWSNEDSKAFFITDAVPTLEAFKELVEKGGVYRKFVESTNGGVIDERIDSGEFNLSTMYFDEANLCASDGSIWLQFEDEYAEDGTLSKRKGTYLCVDLFFEVYTSEFQIPGFNGFERTEIKKIPAEYLPDGVPYEEENIIDIAGMEFLVNLNGDHNGIDGVVNNHNLNLPFALGQKWKCIPIQNGTIEREEYIVELDVIQSDDGALYLGDVDPNGPERVLDFRIDVNTCVGNNSAMTRGGIRHVKIIGISGKYTGEPIVHKVPEKYLPSNIMEFVGDDDNPGVKYKGKTYAVQLDPSSPEHIIVPRELYSLLTVENMIGLVFVMASDGVASIYPAVSVEIYQDEVAVAMFLDGDNKIRYVFTPEDN